MSDGSGNKSLLNSLRCYWEGYWQFLKNDTRAEARSHNEIYLSIRKDLETALGDLKNKKILDAGCGSKPYLALLFHSGGVDARGVDMLLPYMFMPFWKRYRYLLATRNMKQIVFCLTSDLLKRRAYESELKKQTGLTLRKSTLPLSSADLCHMSFSESSFDAVVSINVLEHVLNLNEAISEFHRILRPGGVVYLQIHLFPSLSGGHHPRWDNPAPSASHGVPPWDHLRENKFPAFVPLNRLRKRQYMPILQKYFEPLEIKAEREIPLAEPLLTDDLLAKLPDYTREELLEKSLIFIGRRRPEPLPDRPPA